MTSFLSFSFRHSHLYPYFIQAVFLCCCVCSRAHFVRSGLDEVLSRLSKQQKVCSSYTSRLFICMYSLDFCRMLLKVPTSLFLMRSSCSCFCCLSCIWAALRQRTLLASSCMRSSFRILLSLICISEQVYVVLELLPELLQTVLAQVAYLALQQKVWFCHLLFSAAGCCTLLQQTQGLGELCSIETALS